MNFRIARRFAVKGHADAQHNVACYYYNGEGVEKNHVTACSNKMNTSFVALK